MNFSLISKKLGLFIILSISYLACVEPINLTIKSTDTILVVDAFLDDNRANQSISIKKSIPNAGNAIFSSEVGANVSVIEDGKNTFLTTYSTNGIYNLPAIFRTKVGSFYQLKIKLKDGSEYISSEEKMKFTPDISNIYSKFDPQGIDNGTSRTPSFKVFIDTKDSPELGDNYIWSYKFYERQSYCKTCEGGLFYTTPLPAGRCLANKQLTDDGIVYDYVCEGNCWEIFTSTDINVMADTYSNGNEIKGRQVANIPYLQSGGFLIEITQQNLGTNGFRYLKLLASQSQNTGTLVDSPPGALIGNIININNKDETVGGFFFVGNTRVKTLFIDRKEAIEYFPVSLLGRPAVTEPPAPDGSRPPFAPCIKSSTRTPVRPTGWPTF